MVKIPLKLYKHLHRTMAEQHNKNNIIADGGVVVVANQL